jgi:hypothetical protein
MSLCVDARNLFLLPTVHGGKFKRGQSTRRRESRCHRQPSAALPSRGYYRSDWDELKSQGHLNLKKDTVDLGDVVVVPLLGLPGIGTEAFRGVRGMLHIASALQWRG